MPNVLLRNSKKDIVLKKANQHAVATEDRWTFPWKKLLGSS